MKALIAIILLLLCRAGSHAQQSFRDSSIRWLAEYKAAFITDEHSPLKAADTGYIRFYAPAQSYAVTATVAISTKAASIQMQTHSNDARTYRVYAVASFRLRGKPLQLRIYESVPSVAGGVTHLFIPFNDLTNYETTYGGGRYLDVEKTDIRNGRMLLDFNRAYNPYCAFAEGYSCPIPPAENKLNIRIEAGEQLFGKASD